MKIQKIIKNIILEFYITRNMGQNSSNKRKYNFVGGGGEGSKKYGTLSEITGFATLKTTVVNSINLKDKYLEERNLKI